jgi:hypothetical protein
MFPWYSAAMLGLEANHVMRFGFRNWLLRNGDISAVVTRYREHVSANANRLSLR